MEISRALVATILFGSLIRMNQNNKHLEQREFSERESKSLYKVTDLEILVFKSLGQKIMFVSFSPNWYTHYESMQQIELSGDAACVSYLAYASTCTCVKNHQIFLIVSAYIILPLASSDIRTPQNLRLRYVDERALQI